MQSVAAMHHPLSFPFFLNFSFAFTFKTFKYLGCQSTNRSQMLMLHVVILLFLLIGRRPVPVSVEHLFSGDGWTMCFWGNKNAAHKSLSRHRGQSEMVCKRIIVTPMAL